MEENIAPSIFEDLGKDAQYAEQAGIGLRFANFVIDLIVFLIINYCFFMVLGAVLLLAGLTRDQIMDTFTYGTLTYCIMFIEVILVYTLIEGISKGRSVGKLITRTIVVQEDLTKIAWKHAFIRSVCRMVPFEPVSMLADHPWHDRWSRTIVIKKRQMI